MEESKITHTGQTVCVLKSLLHVTLTVSKISFEMTVNVKY